MNCYNHHNTAAVGICKHCNKGVCPECASDTGDGIACGGSCFEEVKAVTRLIDYNKKVVNGAPSTLNFSGIFFIILGLVFALFPSLFYYKQFDALTAAPGILFIIYGIYTILKGRTYKEDPRKF